MRSNVAISGEELNSAVKMLDMVPILAGVTSSSVVKIAPVGDKARIQVTSSLIGVADVELDGGKLDHEHYVDRHLFFPFVLADEHKRMYKVIPNGNGLVVSHGKRKAEMIDYKSVTGYGKAIETSKSYKFSANQKSAIKAAAKYAVKDPSIRQLSCVHIHEERGIYSSNELAIFQYTDKTFQETLTLPYLIADIIDIAEMKSLKTSKAGVAMHFPVGTLSLPGFAKSSEDFPFKAVVKRFKDALDYPLLFRLPSKPLFEAIKRFSVYTSGLGRIELVVELNGKSGEDQIRLSTKAPQGEFREFVRVDSKLKDDFHVEWMYDLVAPIADLATEAPINVHGTAESPCYLKSGAYKLLLPRKEKI